MGILLLLALLWEVWKVGLGVPYYGTKSERAEYHESLGQSFYISPVWSLTGHLGWLITMILSHLPDGLLCVLISICSISVLFLHSVKVAGNCWSHCPTILLLTGLMWWSLRPNTCQPWTSVVFQAVSAQHTYTQKYTLLKIKVSKEVGCKYFLGGSPLFFLLWRPF